MKRFLRRLSRVADSSSEHRTQRSTATKDGCCWAEVPEGHVPVHVGEEMERFAVRADLLGRPAFAQLLDRSAEVYGFEQRGVIRIPCPVPLFRRVLRSLDASSDG